MTQTLDVLERLSRGPLTPLEALREFGCLRLGARILELRDLGHDIRTEMVQVAGRHGIKRVARYWLVRK